MKTFRIGLRAVLKTEITISVMYKSSGQLSTSEQPKLKCFGYIQCNDLTENHKVNRFNLFCLFGGGGGIKR